MDPDQLASQKGRIDKLNCIYKEILFFMTILLMDV